MEKIIAYLKEKYRASSIIVYGAWADASQSEHSTFEALVMGPTSPYAHDVDIVEGTKLDVVVYPRDIFYGEIALEEFEQVHDGLVALDDDGMGTWLKRMIAQQIESIPAKPDEAIEDSLRWCKEMCAAAKIGDAEGWFCRAWLLTDSVEIYSDVSGKPFLSPRKTMNHMAKEDPEAAKVHFAALSTADQAALEAWVELLERRFEAKKQQK